MACWAALSSSISTNPNPLLRPVSRSSITCALVTEPNAENMASRLALVTLKLRLPTYSFFPTAELLEQKLTTR